MREREKKTRIQEWLVEPFHLMQLCSMKPCQNTQARYFGGAAVISPIIEFSCQLLRGAAAAWSHRSSSHHASNVETAHICFIESE